jgi:hypothetical protein
MISVTFDDVCSYLAAACHWSIVGQESPTTPLGGPDHDIDATRASEIGNLQKPAVADPDSGKVSLGLARRGGVAA